MTRARETSENARQAKAWVNFDGYASSSPYTIANSGIRSAFNVSSVVDEGAGDYTINFDTPFSDNNWVMCGTAKFLQASDHNVPNVGLYRNATTASVMTTSSARVVMGYYNGSHVKHDVEIAMLTFFHDG